MCELEQSQTKPGYPPAKLFLDLRTGLFRELGVKPLDIDLYRRNLQRSYIDMLAGDIKTPAANSDLPAFAREELDSIRDLIRKTDAAGAKPAVQAHLKDLTARITKSLDLRATAEGS
jgi:DNA-binding GntR family transcriptional regulator